MYIVNIKDGDFPIGAVYRVKDTGTANNGERYYSIGYGIIYEKDCKIISFKEYATKL